MKVARRERSRATPAKRAHVDGKAAGNTSVWIEWLGFLAAFSSTRRPAPPAASRALLCALCGRCGFLPRPRGLCARRRGLVALPRTDGGAALGHVDCELVHLAVETRRGETEGVLMVELVGDAREGRRQIVGGCQLEVAAAGGGRDLRQAVIWFVSLRRMATVAAEPAVSATAAAESANATAAAPSAAAGTPAAVATVPAMSAPVPAAAGETDRVHHHVLFLGAFHHVLHAAVGLAEVHRRIHAVGEHQHDAPPLLMQQIGDADVDRVPQRRRPFGLQLGAQDVEQASRSDVKSGGSIWMRFEKLPMRALSAGDISVTNASAAFSTRPKFRRMLPLRSSSITTVIGCTSLAKRVTSWRLPLSSTWKRSRVRSGTSRPP